jgi:hypothetical protein
MARPAAGSTRSRMALSGHDRPRCRPLIGVDITVLDSGEKADARAARFCPRRDGLREIMAERKQAKAEWKPRSEPLCRNY